MRPAFEQLVPLMRDDAKVSGSQFGVRGDIPISVSPDAVGGAPDGMVLGVIAFGASAVKSAAEDQASTAGLIAVLKARKLATDANLKSVDALIKRGQDLAFTDDETRTSIATATQFTKKFADAQKINAIAMDVARAKNISLNAATTLVGKAYAGNLTAAKKLGIEIPKGTKGMQVWVCSWLTRS